MRLGMNHLFDVAQADGASWGSLEPVPGALLMESVEAEQGHDCLALLDFGEADGAGATVGPGALRNRQ